MTRRSLSFALGALFLAASLWRAQAGLRDLRASRLVRAVGATSPAALKMGDSGLALLRQNLALAQEATRLDPASLAAAQALGSVYLLLGRSDDAIAAYQRALALQPTAEIYMDLGHAYHAARAAAPARQAYARAVVLDERLRAQVPPGAL